MQNIKLKRAGRRLKNAFLDTSYFLFSELPQGLGYMAIDIASAAKRSVVSLAYMAAGKSVPADEDDFLVKQIGELKKFNSGAPVAIG